MPLQVRNRPFQEYSQLEERPHIKDQHIRRDPHRQKSGLVDREYRRGGKDKQKLHVIRDRQRSSSKGYAQCTQCQLWKNKCKEQERHFRQLVEIHHQQVLSLSRTNDQLRQELEHLEVRARTAEAQLEKLKSELSYNSEIEGERWSQQLPECSPIGEPKPTTSIKKLTDGSKATFSELLVMTPQASKLGSNPFQAGQKEKALRSEFDRLMVECTSARSKSKKSVLRKQLAGIANQLSLLQSDSVRQ